MRLGIIGCGKMGEKRAASAARCGAKVVTFMDVQHKAAEALARKTGQAHALSSWAELRALDLDAVVIATTHDALAPLTLEAVSSGLHVLTEKPGGRFPEELRAIREEASRRGVCVKVGYNHRFHPALLRAHQLVSDGAVGPLIYLRARYGHGGRPGYAQEWRLASPEQGGGELLDQGSHLLDLSHWFLGDLELEYAAAETLFWDSRCEDNCFLALRGSNGAMAWLHAGWTEWKNVFCFEIAGRDGKLQIDGLGGSYGTERLTLFRMLPEMGPPETTIWEFPFPDTSWDLEFKEFQRAIDEKREPWSGLEDSESVLRIIQDARASHP